MSVFGSLKVSFGSAEVGGGGVEQHVVVAQGGLDHRGGAGVIGEEWVRWVNQGWAIGDDLEQNCMIGVSDFEFTWEYVGWLI